MDDAEKRIRSEVSAFTRHGHSWRTKSLVVFMERNDPRVAVRFDLDGVEYNIAADQYIDPAQNLAGIAEYVKAIRAQERNGIFTAKEMMATFAAPPAPNAPVPWYVVMDLPASATLDQITATYRDLAKMRHPDAPGGSKEAFQELQAAYESAKAARNG